MNRTQASAVLARLVAPLDVGDFLTNFAGRKVLSLKGAPDHPRTALLGDDPRGMILSAWATHAAQFGYHADGVLGPPPSRDGVDGPEAFAALIAEHHARGYTVHIPDLSTLSTHLKNLLTAIEILTRQAAKASLFWSAPGNRAPVHFDARDNLAVQLVGTKRWYVSTEQPRLPNPWLDVRQGPEPLGEHRIVTTEPGDLLFIPRGVLHTVETSTESLHLSITMLPVTLREALIAAVDRLSEDERMLRDTNPTGTDTIAAAVELLARRCNEKGFVEGALERRSGRFVGDLPRLPASPPPVDLLPGTRLSHTSGAQWAIVPLPQTVELAVNGYRLGLHSGAERALRFIAETPAFRLDAIPDLSREVAKALAQRLLQTGALTIDT